MSKLRSGKIDGNGEGRAEVELPGASLSAGFSKSPFAQ